MDSTQLNKILKCLRYKERFSEWHTLNEQCLKQVSTRPGIYVIRKHSGQFGRLRGKSDILYIGSTETTGGLRTRLRRYLYPSRHSTTDNRVHQFLKRYEMDIAWCAFEKPHQSHKLKSYKPRNAEYRLLQLYVEQHYELPPLNHSTMYFLEDGHGTGDDTFYVDAELWHKLKLPKRFKKKEGKRTRA